MDKRKITVVICCAGMGTRLGIGSTKALVNICGKPLIIRQLELLKNYDDIRIVVGYQADRVIRVVNEYRRDIMFVFNNQYETTGPAESLSKGLVGAREYVVAIDGDLIINPQDFEMFMEYQGECLGGSAPNSDEPIYMLTDIDKNAIGFSSEYGDFEWSGVAKIKTSKLSSAKRQIYEMFSPLLPMPVFVLRARDIDTPDDYEKMIEWFENGCNE